MQKPKIEEIKQKDEIINKKNIETENSSLKCEGNNTNEFKDKKSCFMKHRLLIILSIIISVIIIITALIITILITQKKQEKLIVDSVEFSNISSSKFLKLFDDLIFSK